MKRNVGGVDGKVRSLVGAALLGYGLGSGSKGALAAGFFGLLTSAAEYCPVNEVMDLDTAPDSPEHRSLVNRLPSTRDRVPMNTEPEVNERLRRQTDERLRVLELLGGDAIDRRLEELDEEWDIERVIEAESASMILLGTVLGGAVNEKFYALSAFAGAMVLLHGIQGWYPWLPVLRRLGFRTATEILDERRELRKRRGDFGPTTGNGQPKKVRETATR